MPAAKLLISLQRSSDRCIVIGTKVRNMRVGHSRNLSPHFVQPGMHRGLCGRQNPLCRARPAAVCVLSLSEERYRAEAAAVGPSESEVARKREENHRLINSAPDAISPLHPDSHCGRHRRAQLEIQGERNVSESVIGWLTSIYHCYIIR